MVKRLLYITPAYPTYQFTRLQTLQYSFWSMPLFMNTPINPTNFQKLTYFHLPKYSQPAKLQLQRKANKFQTSQLVNLCLCRKRSGYHQQRELFCASRILWFLPLWCLVGFVGLLLRINQFHLLHPAKIWLLYVYNHNFGNS